MLNWDMTVIEFISHLGNLDVQLCVENDQLRVNGPKKALTTSLLEELKERKDDILSFLKTSNEQKRPPIKPVSRGQDLPLSFSQQRLWFLDQLESGGTAYNLCGAVRLSGIPNIPALERSIGEIVNRHETLRTTICSLAGTPIAVIAPAGPWSLEVKNFEHFHEDQRESEAMRFITAEIQKPFDLSHGPLFRSILIRLGKDDHILVMGMHHVVSDGWSIGVFIQELGDLYRAFSSGKSSPLPDLPVQYVDFAHWQREWLQGEVLDAQVNYWKRQLGDDLPVLQLPTDRPRPAIKTYQGAVEKITLSKELARSLKKLSQREGVTLFMTLLAAFNTMLYRYTGQEDIVVGTPVANRTLSEIEGLIGFFVNTLALRNDLSDDPGFRELLGRVREVSLGAYSHQDVPFEKLVEELRPERDLSYSPLFQVMFALQNAQPTSLMLNDLTLTPLDVDPGTSQFDLTLSLRDDGERLVGEMEYSTDLFHQSTITRMLEHFKMLLQGAVSNPDQRLSELPLLTDSERHQLLREWNETDTDYPRGHCIHELFEAQVERTPEATALVFEGEYLTYRELNRRANQLAHHLRSLGIGPEILVGIYMERSLEMVIGILGILKAGGAYVPLDLVYPKERLKLMLDDAQAPVVLTQKHLVENLPTQGGKILLIDAESEAIALQDEENPIHLTTPDSLSYVIYTSGSTGIPKGVLIPHANVVRLFNATHHWFHFDERDTWTLFHSHAFDFSVWEIWGALLYGGKLVVVPYLVSRSPELFFHLLLEERVTVLNQTPSAFYQLIDAENLIENRENLSLRFVIFGGEALDLQSLKPWFDRHGERSPKLVNMYGITETTVHVTYRPLQRADLDSQSGSVIGVPIPDLELYILDRQKRPVPVGVPGEIYVGGAGVALGYLNRLELTAEKFIPNPFSDKEGACLYKTGDLARFLPSRDMEYLGRIDDQVQLRGFRVELGEIEARLSEQEEVKKTIVMVRKDSHKESRLVAYIVPEDGDTLQVSRIRSSLKQSLPDYMIPSAFVVLDDFPLTPNGKIDRKALPAPDNLRPNVGSTYIAPGSDVERTIASLWEKALGIEKIGINDNFFDLGGHSLLMVKINTGLREVFKRDISMVTMFQYPTISSLAEYLSAGQEDQHSFQDVHDRARRQKNALNKRRELARNRRKVQ